MPKWTKEQEQAILEEGSNILVSAGAGSGKTAVLSERALRKVKDGVNIDEILILTFTKAAAYEMMMRIRDKIKKAGFLEQLSRIDKAYITTFDSFSLSIVKKYHDRLNLSKDINIIDENAINLYKSEVLDEIFDSYYQKDNTSFNKLINDFCLKDDKEIKKLILNLNNKLDLKYDKLEYLNNYIETYYSEESINNNLLEYENLLLNNIEIIKDNLSNLSLSLDGDKYQEVEKVLENLIHSTTYDEIKLNLVPSILSRARLDEQSKIFKENINSSLKELEELCIFDNKESMKKDYLYTKDYLIIIIDIIKELDKKVLEYKYKNNMFGFNDIAKLAIDLVKNYPDIKEELKNSFNEIMIDEYQDTSDLQETFISLISNNNVYMVGDIKQSIYRFRNANPLIFKEKYINYSNNNGGVKIDLNKNFRSRDEVLSNINNIFDYIMDNELGGAEYSATHRMIYGNNDYDEKKVSSQNYNIDLYNYHVEKDSDYTKYTKEEIESFIIAKDIKEKIDSNYQVYDKETSTLRNINYNDFVILIDRSSKFTTYKKIFEYLNIPLTILKDENIKDEDEIYLIKNILKLIECLENKDYSNSFKYSFISIARSYLFNYTDEYIFDTINNNSYLDTDIVKICLDIISSINRLSLYKLLCLIIDKFNFKEKLIIKGKIELANTVLDYLLNLTLTLQELEYDYHKFIIYLESVIDSDNKIDVPISESSSNSVKIMTIHKSKGLEYPICYYSGLSATFNISDLKDKIIYDNNYGIITPSFNEGYKDTFYKILLKKKYLKEEISEKIRLFYVALTRCREKMILVSSVDDKTNIDNKLVDYNTRVSYKSFLDILESIYENLVDYNILVDLDSLNLTDKYKYLNIRTLVNDTNNKISVNEVKFDNSEIIEKHYSKENIKLINKEIKNNMEYGTKIHELFENIDFKNPNLDNLNILDKEKEYITKFLNNELLKDINSANILKEYEFYYEKDNEIKHGIIDLILEYGDHIDIIDYKLKYVEDIEYINQLNGYKEYIYNKTNKLVNIYLYSILDNSFKKI